MKHGRLFGSSLLAKLPKQPPGSYSASSSRGTSCDGETTSQLRNHNPQGPWCILFTYLWLIFLVNVSSYSKYVYIYIYMDSLGKKKPLSLSNGGNYRPVANDWRPIESKCHWGCSTPARTLPEHWKKGTNHTLTVQPFHPFATETPWALDRHADLETRGEICRRQQAQANRQSISKP